MADRFDDQAWKLLYDLVIEAPTHEQDDFIQNAIPKVASALRLAASGGVPEGWRPMETAPKDGTVIWIRRIHEGRRIYEGSAAWRTVTFAALHDPITGERFADERPETGWMKPHENHRVPEPTHWQPLSPPPEPGK